MTFMTRLQGCAAGAVLAAGLAACSGVADQTQSDAAGESIYALDLSLTDQAGRQVDLADLGGRVTVAAMIYSACTSACPRVTVEMKTIERQLSGRERDDVRFVLFSLDPERDTPAALSRFAIDHALDASRWQLYAAADDDVRTLAAVLGVKYRPEDNGEISHSAMIFVIDAEGVVRHRQVGLNRTPAEILTAIADARL